MSLPSPPDPFPAFNTRVLPAGSTVVRVHAAHLAGDSFNPCRGGPTRFAPIHTPAGDCIPSLYGAASFEAAVYESIFHNVAHDAGDKFVRLGEVLSKVVTTLETTADLKLARLNEPDLNRLGLTRADLIDTWPSAYPQTARWAEAFHAADPDLSGLAWTSRRADPHEAYVLYGDRTPRHGLRLVDRTEIARSAALLAQVRALGERAGIVLTV